MRSLPEEMAASLVRIHGPRAVEVMRRTLGHLKPSELAALAYHWPFWARPGQLAPPGRWEIWLLLAGRMFGKTRTASEYVLGEIMANRAGLVGLFGATEDDVRGTMVEGKSGIAKIAPPWFKLTCEFSNRRVLCPNGAVIRLFYATEPERFRGAEHEIGWADELAAWPRENLAAAWSNMRMSIRLGDPNRLLVTTTPKPLPLLFQLRDRARRDGRVVITTGSSNENRANADLDDAIEEFGGTRLSRQEIAGELLEDESGALFTLADIDKSRRASAPELRRKVVAVDPAYSTSRGSDETGIVAAGIDAAGDVWVLDDRSGRLSPEAWARCALDLLDEIDGDAIVAERNRGGDLVASNIRAARGGKEVRIVEVTASRGKAIRADGVANRYAQGRIHHVGELTALEDQMTRWDPAREASPDRLDALVWAVFELAKLGEKKRENPGAFSGIEEANRGLELPNWI